MNAVIFANADISDYGFCKKYTDNSDFIICCDGGMRHTKALGILPDYIMGDFDSVEPDVLEFYKEKGIKIKTFPTKKDFTDTELGLNYAMELGADDITIIGGIGSRLDHTLANCHILAKAVNDGISARLVNENNCVTVTNNKAEINGEVGDLVSLLPMSAEVTGVSTKGLEYQLNDGILKIGTALGISNVMSEPIAQVTVKNGYLIIIKAKD